MKKDDLKRLHPQVIKAILRGETDSLMRCAVIKLLPTDKSVIQKKQTEFENVSEYIEGEFVSFRIDGVKQEDLLKFLHQQKNSIRAIVRELLEYADEIGYYIKDPESKNTYEGLKEIQKDIANYLSNPVEDSNVVNIKSNIA